MQPCISGTCDCFQDCLDKIEVAILFVVGIVTAVEAYTL